MTIEEKKQELKTYYNDSFKGFYSDDCENVTQTPPLQQTAVIGWVAVSERLPEPKKHVLVLRTNPNIVTTGYLHEWGHWIWSNLNGSTHKADHIYKVTHWMPLPEPPCL